MNFSPRSLRRISWRDISICLFTFILVSAVTVQTGFAVDGQIDILPSSTSGYTINQPGSYVLVADVTISAQGTDGIVINANNVTLDLNGHILRGPNAGAGVGINHTGSKGYQCRIFNGKVAYFNTGIKLNADSTVENMTVSSNLADGIETASSCKIYNCILTFNGDNGISTGSGCIIDGCNASANNLNGNKAGFKINANSFIKNCISQYNSPSIGNDQAAYGINAGTNCKIINNHVTKLQTSASANPGFVYGIAAGAHSEIRGNSVIDNTCASDNSLCCGIKAASDSTIRGNICNKNKVSGSSSYATGIYCTDRCLVENNQCNENICTVGSNGNNGKGIEVIGAESIIIGNSCSGNRGINLSSIGIHIRGDGARVENNFCSSHTGASGANYGILVDNTDCVVIGNRTTNNSTKGIAFTGTGNYVAENTLSDGIDAGTNTVGTGDRSNITF